MATSTITKHALNVFYTDQLSVPNGQAYVYATASPSSGWHFICWLGAFSDGWTGLVYPSSYNTETTTLWMKDTTQTGRKVKAAYLCERL